MDLGNEFDVAPWVFVAKIFSSVCALIVAVFLIKNYLSFRGRINACMSLFTYYTAAMVSIIMDVMTSWMLTGFDKVTWLFPFQIGTLSEAIMALAYSAIMFELAEKIKIIEKTKNDNCEGQKDKLDAKLIRKLRLFLGVSIGILLVIFAITTTVFGVYIHSV